MSSTAEDLLRRHRYQVEDYYRMAETGILAPDARVELINGEILDMPPIGPPHASVVTLLHARLIRAAGDSAIVRSQNPVRLDRYNEPEPDIALVRPRTGHYRDRHPGPADILLLVEVAESSLRYDRDLKIPLYARFGIPEVWLLDLTAKTLTRFSHPDDSGYVQFEGTAVLGQLTVPGTNGAIIDLTDLF
jgi:Uma2 family endonuclease